MNLAMTGSERESFLAELHVGIVAINDPERAPVAAPVWYSYQPGGTLRFVTARTSLKANLINRSGRITLIAQTETAPYKYVAVQGSATIIGEAKEPERRALAHRYLGEELGNLYMEATADADDVVVEIVPEVWRTTDFAKALE